MYCTCGDRPYGAFRTKSGHFGPSDNFFQGPKGQICDYLGSQNGLIRWLMDLIESPGGPKSLQMGH